MASQIIKLYKGDIITCNVSAIVNSAQETLTGGGGIDGRIHAACGKDLNKEIESTIIADYQGVRCYTGCAVITSAPNLNQQYIIHTVGPYLAEDERTQPSKLRSCYSSCFKLARKYNIRSIAFPCISTGFYGFPHKEAANIAIEIIRQYAHYFDEIIICVYLDLDFDIYKKLI